jgi:hypothetical protein
MPALSAERSIGFVPIGEATERLGVSQSSAVRRFRLGRLSGYQALENRYIYVDTSSVAEALQRLKALNAASGLPGDRPLDARYRSPGSL